MNTDESISDKYGLKPCPHCGHNNLRILENDQGDSVTYGVSCDDCWALGPSAVNEYTATMLWNIRSQ